MGGADRPGRDDYGGHLLLHRVHQFCLHLHPGLREADDAVVRLRFHGIHRDQIPARQVGAGAPGAPGGGGGQDRGAAGRTAAPAFSVHDRAGAGDGQRGGAGVLGVPGGLLHLSRMGNAGLAGQARLCGGRRGGHGRVVRRAKLGGVTRPWQTQREDTACGWNTTPALFSWSWRSFRAESSSGRCTTRTDYAGRRARRNDL